MSAFGELGQWTVGFIAKHFDQIALSAFALCLLLVFFLFTQGRNGGIFRSSWKFKPSEHLTPAGRIAYSLFAAIFVLFVVFALTGLAYVIYAN